MHWNEKDGMMKCDEAEMAEFDRVLDKLDSTSCYSAKRDIHDGLDMNTYIAEQTCEDIEDYEVFDKEVETDECSYCHDVPENRGSFDFCPECGKPSQEYMDRINWEMYNGTNFS